MENDHDIYGQLAELAQSDTYPFHMPGHKRNSGAGLPAGFAQLDITEIENFDNLHHAQGILKEAMRNAAQLYGSQETFFLVNGSTCGVLASLSSVLFPKDTLILGRNAHMSAYHSAYLRGCKIVSLYPELFRGYGIYGAVSPGETERMLVQYPEAKAVMITSPTYDGIVSDVRAIAEVVHAHGKILIVDEAHGAHFGLDARLPLNGVQCGADIVIHSLHKTLPSLTQTALLHVNGERVDRERIKRFLKIYQSSSPSYLLMGSIDRCIRELQKNRVEWFDSFFKKRKRLLTELLELKTLTVVSGEAGCFDPGKLLIFCDRTPCSGVELQEILLKKYHLQMELAGEYYVLAILTVMDTQEGYLRLAKALKEIDAGFANAREAAGTEPRGQQKSLKLPDARLRTRKARLKDDQGQTACLPDHFAEAVASQKNVLPRMTLAEAMDESDTEPVKTEKTAGRIATEFIYAYPPGIPVILPGEIITKQTLELIMEYREKGLQIQGPADESLRTIRCIRESETER